MSLCFKCSNELTSDEIGIYKKLINRGANKFMCKVCLAHEFNCSVELINQKIEEFKEMGCTLFIK